MTITALVTLIVWICLAFVFLPHNRVLIGILLAAVTFGGSFAVYFVLSNLNRGFEDWETFFNTLGFYITLAGSILAVLFLFYSIGYRLHRVEK